MLDLIYWNNEQEDNFHCNVHIMLGNPRTATIFDNNKCKLVVTFTLEPEGYGDKHTKWVNKTSQVLQNAARTIHSYAMQCRKPVNIINHSPEHMNFVYAIEYVYLLYATLSRKVALQDMIDTRGVMAVQFPFDFKYIIIPVLCARLTFTDSDD